MLVGALCTVLWILLVPRYVNHTVHDHATLLYRLYPFVKQPEHHIDHINALLGYRRFRVVQL